MTRPRLPVGPTRITPSRRGGGSGEPASQPVPPLLVDSREVARLLGIGRTKAFELMARDELPVVRIGRSVRVLRSALESWANRQADRHATSQTVNPRGWLT